MKLYLGIDGGQSATKAAVGDAAGRLLGRGFAGPCNHVGAAEGRVKLEGAVRESVGEALAAGSLSWNEARFAAACCAMSGGPDDKREVLAALLGAERLEVTTDAHAALWGAHGGGPGVIVIAGTGSIALAEDAAGRTARAGGWGYVFGDEGGGFDLVRQALRAALRMEEGWGPATALRSKLLAATAAPDANALLHRFYTEAWPRPRIAALAPLVNEAAEKGDAAASAILAGAGESLAALARAAGEQIFGPGEAPPVGMVGGLFRSPLLREAFRASLGWPAREPLYPPDVGALLRAWRTDGIAPTEVRL